MAQAPVSLQPRSSSSGGVVRLDRLAECVRRLDPATRALLDLSVRRGVRDDAMAPVLHTDPFHLAWRRARALEQVAAEVGDGDAPAPLGEVRMALEALPAGAWGLPGAGPPTLPAGSAEAAAAARATGAELVPAASAELGSSAAREGRLARLDAFAAESPTLRLAIRQLGRAVAAKAVRLVVWRRRAT